jgi:hypothetical protein
MSATKSATLRLPVKDQFQRRFIVDQFIAHPEPRFIPSLDTKMHFIV